MSKATDKAIRIAVGVIVCAYFGYLQVIEIRTDNSLPHELLWSGGFLFGTLAIFPPLLRVFTTFIASIAAAWKGRQ